MANNITFTSTMNEELMEQLNRYTKKFKIPKNKLIEFALAKYFERLKKAEYIRSFRRASKDEDMQSIAEEDMVDYLKNLDQYL